MLLERKKGEEGRGERRFADNPDMLRLLEPRIEKRKKNFPHHTPLFRSHFSPPSSPSPPHPFPLFIPTPLNPSSKNPTKDHKKNPETQNQRIHHPNLNPPLPPPPPKKKETKRPNKTVTTRQEALGHMKEKKKKKKERGSGGSLMF